MTKMFMRTVAAPMVISVMFITLAWLLLLMGTVVALVLFSMGVLVVMTAVSIVTSETLLLLAIFRLWGSVCRHLVQILQLHLSPMQYFLYYIDNENCRMLLSKKASVTYALNTSKMLQ